MKRVQVLLSMATLMSLFFSFVVVDERNVQAENLSVQIVETNADNKTVRPNYGKMPLLFEENKGQTSKQAKFVARGSGYTLYLTETEAVFQLRMTESGLQDEIGKPKTKSDILKMQFVGANADPTVEGETEAVTKTNYYIGKKRFENLPNYKRVNYKNLYKGIDAVFYGNQSNQLEYDFTIAPLADANQVKLNFDGAENISVDANGNLIVKTANTELVQQKPFAYQEINGERKEIEARYVITEQSPTGNSKSQVSFGLGEYDRSKTLVIDPALNYLTYIGGSGTDRVRDISVDSNGNAYIVGVTLSLDFPAPRDSRDSSGVFVAKIDPDGTAFLYTTILEGEDSDDGNSIAIDAAGNAFIAGTTQSDQFPTSSNAYQERRSFCNVILTPAKCGSSNDEVFVTKLNVSGQIAYSTYLGGQRLDQGKGIAVDTAGKAYITGVTESGLTFPKKNEFQGTGVFGIGDDAFLTVFNAGGTDITYSSGLGGNGKDRGLAIVLDSANNAYIGGSTDSEGSFPTKNAFQTTNGGGKDGFVAKFNPAASGDASLIYSTFLGGGGTEEVFGIAVNAGGQAHVTGITGSFDFPLQNAFRSTNQINEAFVSVLGLTGALTDSSFLGGSNQDEGKDIAVGKNGLIYVTGTTLSSDFQTALPFQAINRGGRDAFVTKLKFGSGIISSSYLGGNVSDFSHAIGVSGNFIYAVGETQSNNLATTSGAIKTSSNASATSFDGFVAKILDTHLDSVGVFRPSTTFLLTQSTTNIVSQTATFTTQLSGQNGISGDWNGDGIDTIGSFTNGVWKNRNQNFPLFSLPATFGFTTINFGQAGDLPVAGDWDGDGIDTPGAYRPSAGQFFLTNSLATTPNVDITVDFGEAGDLPVAGDWNGDGIDTVGVFRPSVAQFFLTNTNRVIPNIDFVASFGTSDDFPIGGDWDGNGVDTIGLARHSTGEFFLSNDNVNIANQFFFGANGDQPIAGDWDGKP